MEPKPVRSTAWSDLWPVVASSAFLVALIGVTLLISLQKNDGHFIYAVDDAYIHLSIAQNFADYGVWGITPYEFSSSSSSLLWTLVLAFLHLIVPSVLVPFGLNCITALLLLYGCNRLLLGLRLGALVRMSVLSALVLAAPALPLIFSGMEHVVQIGLAVWLVHMASSELAQPGSVRSWQLGLLALLGVMIRFEGLFIVAIAGLLFCLQRRQRLAIMLGLSALLPVIIYGSISQALGWYFLPSSIIAKTSLNNSRGFPLLPNWSTMQRVYIDSPRFLFCMLLSTLLFAGLALYHRPGLRSRAGYFHMLALGTAILHLCYAGLGWFYRYEAYLVIINLLASLTTALVLLDQGAPRMRRIIMLAAGANILICSAIGLRASLITRAAMHDIYRQQYQLIRFANQYGATDAIMINDIGAISYYGDHPILDGVGLASFEVLKLRREGRWNPTEIEALAKQLNVKLVMVFANPRWLGPIIPAHWSKVGTWTVEHSVVSGYHTVTFFVLRPEDAPRLRAALQSFNPSLPAGVSAVVDP